MPDRYDGSGIVEKIRMVADVAAAGGRGDCLAHQVESDLASLASLRAKVTQPKRVMFVISFLNGKPMVAGRNTAADGIIRMARAVNAIDAYEGYKQISDEAVIAACPHRAGHAARARQYRRRNRVLACGLHGNAGCSTQVLHRDGRALSARLRLRTATAARDLAETLYPALGHAVLPSEWAPGGCY